VTHRRRSGVDLVAVILASGLSLAVVLILVATMVQILNNEPGAPEIQLSENATQILIAAIGGIVGVLGGYIGYRLHDTHSQDDE
jgi:hypothetical protein